MQQHWSFVYNGSFLKRALLLSLVTSKLTLFVVFCAQLVAAITGEMKITNTKWVETR